MDIRKSLNREEKRKKEQKKIKRPKSEDRREDYKNKTLNIKKRRKSKEELEYEEGIGFSGGMYESKKPTGDGNWSRSRTNR